MVFYKKTSTLTCFVSLETTYIYVPKNGRVSIPVSDDSVVDITNRLF